MRSLMKRQLKVVLLLELSLMTIFWACAFSRPDDTVYGFGCTPNAIYSIRNCKAEWE